MAEHSVRRVSRDRADIEHEDLAARDRRLDRAAAEDQEGPTGADVQHLECASSQVAQHADNILPERTGRRAAMWDRRRYRQQRFDVALDVEQLLDVRLVDVVSRDGRKRRMVDAMAGKEEPAQSFAQSL